MIVFGIDMGIKTTTITILEFKHKNVRFVHSELVPVSLLGMTKKDIDATPIFRNYFRKMIKQYRPAIVSPELFMARSFRSNLGMPISYLIGVMASLCIANKISFRPQMPASWKRDLEKKIAKVDTFYDLSYPIKQRLPNHAIDSFFLALFQHPKGFECVSNTKLKILLSKLRKNFTSLPPVLEKDAPVKRAKRKKRVSQKK